MSVTNAGPEPIGHECDEAVRRGNPSFVYRDDDFARAVWAAGTRASMTSHRFGVARHALTHNGQKLREGGDSDESR